MTECVAVHLDGEEWRSQKVELIPSTRDAEVTLPCTSKFVLVYDEFEQKRKAEEFETVLEDLAKKYHKKNKRRRRNGAKGNLFS